MSWLQEITSLYAKCLILDFASVSAVVISAKSQIHLIDEQRGLLGSIFSCNFNHIGAKLLLLPAIFVSSTFSDKKS